MDVEKLRLIGFSIRVSPSANAAWSPERQRVNLLKPINAQVISIDDAVWPIPQDIDAALKSVGGMENVVIDENALNLMSSIPSSWLHGEMALPEFMQHCVLIAAAVTEDDYTGLKKTYKWLIDEAFAGDAMQKVLLWSFLGFDVADVTGISGLTNSGIAVAMSDRERLTWSAKLGRTGLFERLTDAHEFARVADRLVEEHAPFMPVGIWQR